MRATIQAAAVAMAFSALCAIAPSEAAPTQKDKPMVVLMGSVTNTMWAIDPTAMEKTAAYARTLGVDAFETYTPWTVFEPKAAGQFNWTETDKLNTICTNTGLKWQAFVMLNPSYATPEWFKKSGQDVPHRCLEHGKDSDIRSIWCPDLDKHVDRVLGAFFARYGDSPNLESVMFGVSGDFGESIYPAGAVGWNGQYHNHPGYWCAEAPAVASLRGWLKTNYKTIDRLNKAWGSQYIGFDDVTFLLPSEKMSDARWLDQTEWYRGEMTRWCETWMRIGRKYVKRDTPLYLCVGGGDNVPLGFDITGQAKVCAANNVFLRLTNEGSVYASNFMGTRQLTTAAKLYGTPSGLEPAGAVDENGIVARIFGAAAAGCNHLHYYEGQVANFNSCSPAGKGTDNWNAEKDHLLQKAPYVNVAAFYPRVDALCKRQMGTESLDRYNGLRDYVDFDFVDDNLAKDKKLDRYRYILLGPCETMEAGAAKELLNWVKDGGMLIASEQSAFRTWKRFGLPAITKSKPLTGKAVRWATAKVDMPAVFAISPGRLPAGVQLTGTWSWPEGDFRWGGKDAGIALSVDPTLDYTLTYEGGVPVGGKILVNGHELGTVQGGEGNEYSWTFDVPASMLDGSDTMRIEFRMTPLSVPPDTRDLSLFPKMITLRAAGGNPSIDAPRLGEVRVDRSKLMQSTTLIGKGCVIALPAEEMSSAQYARTISALLRTKPVIDAPTCVVPDGAGNDLFVTCRGDEVLVYNASQKPATAALTIPSGAELDRTHVAVGTTIKITGMAPNSIEAYPLKLQSTGK